MSIKTVTASSAGVPTGPVNGSLWITATPPGRCADFYARRATETFWDISETTLTHSSVRPSTYDSHRLFK